jgi:hypothetical protein
MMKTLPHLIVAGNSNNGHRVMPELVLRQTSDLTARKILARGEIKFY